MKSLKSVGALEWVSVSSNARIISTQSSTDLLNGPRVDCRAKNKSKILNKNQILFMFTKIVVWPLSVAQ